MGVKSPPVGASCRIGRVAIHYEWVEAIRHSRPGPSELAIRPTVHRVSENYQVRTCFLME
jgi:hypothetical protein